MKLYPIERDLPAQYWYCQYCDRKITIDERDRTWKEVIEHLIKKYNLHKMVYNARYGNWKIEQKEWISAKSKGLKGLKQCNSVYQNLIQIEICRRFLYKPSL